MKNFDTTFFSDFSLIQREADIKFLQNLSKYPELNSNQIKKVKEVLEWLEEESNRYLGKAGCSFREIFNKMETRAIAIREGTVKPQKEYSPEEREAYKKKMNRKEGLKRIQRKENNLPAWMKDKSLLPKKPPAKKSEDGIH